jgi:PAS domain S-box-containing protein
MSHHRQEGAEAGGAVPRDEQPLRAILDSMLDPLALIEAVRDESGAIVDFIYLEVNPASCAYFGMARQELLGTSMRAVFPNLVASGTLAMYARVVETGEPLALDDLEYENEILGESRRYEVRASRIGEALSVTWRDVTARREEARRLEAFTEALAESEARLHRSLAASRAGIWEWDLASGDLLWSDETWWLSGMEPSGEPPSLASWLQTIHPEDRERVSVTIGESVKHEVAAVIDYRVVMRDGAVRWLSARGSPHFDGDGGLVGYIGAVIDVTEQKTMEQALRESEARYRVFAENAGDVVYEGGADGVLRWVSPSVTALLGWLPEQMVGTSFLDFLHPDDLVAMRETRRGPAFAEGAFRRELRVRDAWGGHRWVVATVRNVVDEEPGAVTRVGSWRDIQAEVEERQARAASERHYRALSENTPDFVFVIGRDLRLRFVNESLVAAFGTPPEELAGCGIDDLFDPLTAAYMRSEHASAVSTGTPVHTENSVRGPWGVRWFSTWLVPIPDEHGEVEEVVGVSRDITDIKAAGERLQGINVELEERVAERTRELEATNTELEAFAYSISHDLRAPLRAIDGFSHLVAQDYGQLLPEAGREDLQRIRAAAQKMGQLIDAMLALSRLSRQQIEIRPVDLSALACEIAVSLAEQYPDREVEFHAAEGCAALADVDLIGVVIANLLDNAWKFTAGRDDAHVEFGEAREGEGGAAVRAFFVRDDGVGFDPVYAGKLFEPFHRLHRDEEYPGTGIGLATVQRIVSRLGGECWAEGAVGRGATFIFTLPSA